MGRPFLARMRREARIRTVGMRPNALPASEREPRESRVADLTIDGRRRADARAVALERSHRSPTSRGASTSWRGVTPQTAGASGGGSGSAPDAEVWDNPGP